MEVETKGLEKIGARCFCFCHDVTQPGQEESGIFLISVGVAYVGIACRVDGSEGSGVACKLPLREGKAASNTNLLNESLQLFSGADVLCFRCLGEGDEGVQH